MLPRAAAELAPTAHLLSLAKEAAMYFVRKVPFDSDPFTFQLANCVLNLKTNFFETTTKSLGEIPQHPQVDRTSVTH